MEQAGLRSTGSEIETWVAAEPESAPELEPEPDFGPGFA